jgi:hypothetical protein
MSQIDECIRIVLLVSVLSAAAAPGFSQDVANEEGAAEEVSTETWDSTIRGRVAGNQSGYHNWQEGGSSTIAFASEIRGSAERETEEWSQAQSFRLAFGQKKQGGLSFRKDQDIVLYDFSLQYQGNSNLDPTVSGEFRTQFAPSFNYKTNPFDDGREPPIKVSDALSPGYIKQSLGLTYDPNEWSSYTFGLASKETVVLIDRLRPLYMEGINQSVRVQVGVDGTASIEKEIFENVTLQSRLSLFAAFHRSELPDMRWENRIMMKVNEWIEVDIEAVAYYDRDVSTELQFRENLSVGASYTFL